MNAYEFDGTWGISLKSSSWNTKNSSFLMHFLILYIQILSTRLWVFTLYSMLSLFYDAGQSIQNKIVDLRFEKIMFSKIMLSSIVILIYNRIFPDLFRSHLLLSILRFWKNWFTWATTINNSIYSFTIVNIFKIYLGKIKCYINLVMIYWIIIGWNWMYF